MDTSGFYALIDGELFFAPNFVESATFSLHRADKDTYTYPVNGWSWFDSEQEAKTFFNITDEEAAEI